MTTADLPAISLFSGLGGLDQGLESAGLDIRVCLEKDEDRVATLRSNKPKWKIIEDDIRNVPTSRILEEAKLKERETFMVAGGPPCQPFSKSAYWVGDRSGGISEDPRTRMLDEFLRVLLESQPATFLLENVPGLGYKTSKSILRPFLEVLSKAGYNPQCGVLNAVDYGVPQKRKRFFVIGARNSSQLCFPDITHAPSGETSEDVEEWVTAGDAIANLDNNVVREEEEIGGKYGHLLEQIPPGDNYLYFTKKRGHPNPRFEWRSRFWTFLLKLSSDLPSWTIQANPAKYQGPFHWNSRHLRIEELKALQSIPLNWKILGSSKSVRRQIGDACPPPLSKAIAERIVNQMMHQTELT